MKKELSTNKASRKLSRDLNLSYGLGRKVVAHFFDLISETPCGAYWEPKINYNTLLEENENIDNLKFRIKKKIKTKWKNDIENIFPNPEKRRKLYLEAFNSKKTPAKMPNAVLMCFLVEKLGHYNENKKGFSYS